MSHGANSTKVVMAALAGNGLIAISKFVAAFLTGSGATLAEAVHSVADTLNQALLMLGMRRGKRKPTELHPFGHAAETYFWPFLVSIMIFFLGGLFAFWEGVHIFMSPEPEESGSSWINYIVLGAALVFEGYSFTIAMKEFKKTRGDKGTLEAITLSKDPTIPVVLLEDSAALVGLVIALIAVTLSDFSGWSGWDAIGSILIGVVLCGVSYLLSRETHSLLIGESASPDDRATVADILDDEPTITSLRQMLTMHQGPEDVVLALKVDFDKSVSVQELESAINRVEAAIRKQLPRMTHIFIEPDSQYDASLDPERPFSVSSSEGAES